MKRVVLVATAAFVLLPSTAAADVRLEARDVLVSAARGTAWSWRALPSEQAPYRFNMVGIHWRGHGDVFVRTAKAGEPWGFWRDAGAEDDDAPDAASGEAKANRGWRLGSPLWVGPSDRLQLNVAGDVRRVRTFFIASRVEETAQPRRTASVAEPAIIPRRAWGANESIVRARPYFGEQVAFSVVHHTAGAQPSTPAQSAAIVRGIQTYHVKGNGWNDIGYNFLVDRFGQIFEGRGGGIDAPVVGAHAQGFNTGSVGVAVIGNFAGSRIPSLARRALVRLLAWRLDRAHVNPTSKLVWRSAGNPKYPPGRRVKLRAVSGHRDTGPTSCPGGALWRQLGPLGRSVREWGGTKIFRPRSSGSLGGPVRIRARVDPGRAWRVTVVDGSGQLVAQRTGTGASVDWTWDSSAAPREIHRWVVSAGDAYEGTGLVGSGGAPPPAPGEILSVVSSLSRPRVLSPNGDRLHDAAKLIWRTSIAAEVKVVVLNQAGQVLGDARGWRVVGPGKHRAIWNGALVSGAQLPDGRYTLRFRARAGAQSASRDLEVTLDRTLGFVSFAPRRFSPNADGRKDAVTVSFTLTRSADVTLRAKPRAAAAVQLFDESLGTGTHTLVWNGSLDGAPTADGSYTLGLAATTGLGTRWVRARVRLDTTRPVVSRLFAKRAGRGTRVGFRLDEAGRVAVWFGEERVEIAGSVGRNRVWRRLRVDSVSVRSWDAAGNRSALRNATVRGYPSANIGDVAALDAARLTVDR